MPLAVHTVNSSPRWSVVTSGWRSGSRRNPGGKLRAAVSGGASDRRCNCKPDPKQRKLPKQPEHPECAVMFNKRAESGTVLQLIKHNCLFWISGANTAPHQKHRKTTAHAAARQHGGESFRRLLFKHTNPIMPKQHYHPVRKATAEANTQITIYRRKEAADKA